MRACPLTLIVLLSVLSVVVCGNAARTRNCSPNSNCGISLAAVLSASDSKNCSFVHIDAFSATIVDMLDVTQLCAAVPLVELQAMLARSTLDRYLFYYFSGVPNTATSSINVYTAELAALPAAPVDGQLYALHALNGQLYALTDLTLSALTIGVDASFRPLLSVSQILSGAASVVSNAASATARSSFANADFLYVVSTSVDTQSTVHAVNLSSLAVSSTPVPQQIGVPLTVDYYLPAPTPTHPDPVPYLLFTTATGVSALSLDAAHQVISVMNFSQKLASAKTAFLEGTLVVATENQLNTWLLSSDLSTATPQSASPFPQYADVFGSLPAFD